MTLSQGQKAQPQCNSQLPLGNQYDSTRYRTSALTFIQVQPLTFTYSCQCAQHIQTRTAHRALTHPPIDILFPSLLIPRCTVLLLGRNDTGYEVGWSTPAPLFWALFHQTKFLPLWCVNTSDTIWHLQRPVWMFVWTDLHIKRPSQRSLVF